MARKTWLLEWWRWGEEKEDERKKRKKESQPFSSFSSPRRASEEEGIQTRN